MPNYNDPSAIPHLLSCSGERPGQRPPSRRTEIGVISGGAMNFPASDASRGRNHLFRWVFIYFNYVSSRYSLHLGLTLLADPYKLRRSSVMDIQRNGLSRSISNSLNVSTSPDASTPFSPELSFRSQFSNKSDLARTTSSDAARQLRPFAQQEIKILLLENVNEVGQKILKDQGYQVEVLKSALQEDDLIEKVKEVHVLGIRSKTKVTARVLNAAQNLLVIGCFCIGTNQVDLVAAANKGIAVFNSPFSNSRSVAELVIAEIIALARQLAERSMELHQGRWNKISTGCWEVRGKTLGIVGYGHIGAQLSVLAEGLGMSVVYYDVVNLMSMGTAKQLSTLDEVLEASDFVTLHIPETPETKNMIGAEQLARMRNGSYLINASRGSIVDIQALIDASRSGKIAGAALDVYPNEPAGNGDYFTSSLNAWAEQLRSCKNIILTPHIGGSTEEAQRAIGVEVANALVGYVNEGVTIGACNMPEVQLRGLAPDDVTHVRVVFIHKNVPGVLRRVNEILGDHNVEKQMSDSRGDVAYAMADVRDVNKEEIRELYDGFEGLGSRIRTRFLW